MKDDNRPRLGEAIMKGLLIGGSIGMMAGWFMPEPTKPLILGFLCGILAGVTFWLREKNR